MSVVSTKIAGRVAVPIALALAGLVASAQQFRPARPVHRLFAGMSTGSALNPGGVAWLNESTFAGNLIADPVTPGGLSGLTFTLDGRLWGTVRFGGGSMLTNLVELDPVTGDLLGQVALKENGVDVRIADLATQPGTGTVFGVGTGTSGMGGDIFTIHTTTGACTLVGNPGLLNDGGLGFAADGTLYLISATPGNPFLLVVNPSTGAGISSIRYGPSIGLDGLVVRPRDGALLGTRGGMTGGDQIVRIDPLTGSTTLEGPTGIGTASDIAYYP